MAAAQTALHTLQSDAYSALCRRRVIDDDDDDDGDNDNVAGTTAAADEAPRRQRGSDAMAAEDKPATSPERGRQISVTWGGVRFCGGLAIGETFGGDGGGRRDPMLGRSRRRNHVTR